MPLPPVFSTRPHNASDVLDPDHRLNTFLQNQIWRKMPIHLGTVTTAVSTTASTMTTMQSINFAAGQMGKNGLIRIHAILETDIDASRTWLTSVGILHNGTGASAGLTYGLSAGTVTKYFWNIDIWNVGDESAQSLSTMILNSAGTVIAATFTTGGTLPTGSISGASSNNAALSVVTRADIDAGVGNNTVTSHLLTATLFPGV